MKDLCVVHSKSGTLFTICFGEDVRNEIYSKMDERSKHYNLRKCYA